MRLFGYPYNDMVICKDSPDYLSFVMIPVVLSLVIGCDRRQIGTRCVKDGIIGRKVM